MTTAYLGRLLSTLTLNLSPVPGWMGGNNCVLGYAWLPSSIVQGLKNLRNKFLHLCWFCLLSSHKTTNKKTPNGQIHLCSHLNDYKGWGQVDLKYLGQLTASVWCILSCLYILEGNFWLDTFPKTRFTWDKRAALWNLQECSLRNELHGDGKGFHSRCDAYLNVKRLLQKDSLKQKHVPCEYLKFTAMH